MKLSAWARQQGLSYKTAWRLWKAGQLPVPAEQLATGTVIVHAAAANEPPGVALYARVSSGEQKADLDRQLSRLVEFSAKHGFRVVEAVQETGSGLHGRRKALLRVFRNPRVQVIVVEHRDGESHRGRAVRVVLSHRIALVPTAAQEVLLRQAV